MEPSGTAEGSTLDRYVVGPRLGYGGFGAVHRARHTILETEVALKILSPEHAGDVEVVQRFLREAKTAAAVGNPHIVTVFDAGVAGGIPFLAMELLEGEDLEHRIARAGALSIDEAIDIALQVLDGLEAAHARGIVHRDMKPGNVFLVRREGRVFVKIVDFGISKISEPAQRRLTQSGAMLGTPGYMAPEQLVDLRHVDGRADVYAVAVLLFEALTGRLPFPADSFADVIARLSGAEPSPLERYLPDAPPGLGALIRRGLEAEPAQRWESAAAMAHALSAVRRGAAGAGWSAGPPNHTRPLVARSAGPDALGATMPVERARGVSAPLSAPPSAPLSAPLSAPVGAPGMSTQRAEGTGPGLWIAVGAAALLIPLACVGGVLLTMALAPERAAPITAPSPAPALVSPTPPPSPVLASPTPPPPSISVPLPPPPGPVAVPDAPPTPTPLPAGARACDVAVHHEVACDRRPEPLDLSCREDDPSELHLFAAYTPHTEDGAIVVDVARTVAPLVLVLSSYSAAAWEVRLAPGARVERVLLSGYQRSRVTGLPPGTPVEEAFQETRTLGEWPATAFGWDGISPSASGRELARVAELRTRLGARSYAGCYAATRFVLGQ